MLPLTVSIIAAFLVAVFAVKKPIGAVAVTILFLPSFLIRWHVGNISFNTLDVLIITGFLAYLATHRNAVKDTVGNKPLTVATLSVLCAAALAVLVSPNTREALGIFKSYFFLPVLFTFMLASIVNSRKNLLAALFSFAVLALLVSIVAILQKLSPGVASSDILGIPNQVWRNPETFRVTSILRYPNALGLLLAPLVPLFFAIPLLSKNRSAAILSSLSLAFSLYAIFLAKSKGALMGLAGATVLFLLVRYRIKAVFALLLLFALALFSIPSLDYLIARAGPGSYSAQLRFTQWKETLELLKDSPVMGAGLSGFQAAIAPYHTRDYIEIFLYPHNIFLNFWVELGLLGLLVFTVLISYTLYKNTSLARREDRTVKNLALLGILSFTVIIVHGLVDVPYFKNDLAVLFWFVWLWPLILTNIKDQGEKLL